MHNYDSIQLVYDLSWWVSRLDIATMIISLIALWVAIYIWLKQMDISNRQINLSKWQFDVDCIRYKLDVVNMKITEILNKWMSLDNKIATHNLSQLEIDTLNEINEENRLALLEYQKMGEVLVGEYNDCLKRHP